MSEKNQINDFVSRNLGDEDYIGKMKVLKSNTENLIKKVCSGSTDLSKQLRTELDEFKNFLDQVFSKLEKIKKERRKLETLDVFMRSELNERGVTLTFKPGIRSKLDAFRDYGAIAIYGSKLFSMSLSEIWAELGNIYCKFVDETKDLSIEKRMPITSFCRFMNILTEHFKKKGYNLEIAQVLFLSKIFFDGLEIRGFDNPQSHIKKSLKYAFIEPTTPTSEMSVYGLELNIQLTNLLYDIFAMCSDGKTKAQCLRVFARKLKMVANESKIPDVVKKKEAFITQVELFYRELKNKDCKDYLKDYLGNSDINVKNKLAFVCGLSGIGCINFEDVEKYFSGIDSIYLRIFICTHGLAHLPGYQTILGKHISNVKSRFIVNNIFDFRAVPFNNESTDLFNCKFDDLKPDSLELDSFLKLELKGYGSKVLNDKEKMELAKGCYCYKEIIAGRYLLKLMFNNRFDNKRVVKNLLMEQNTPAIEGTLQPFENKVLKFLAFEKGKRKLEYLKNIVKLMPKEKYNSPYDEVSMNIDDSSGKISLVCELYSLLDESDKTFKNLYDLLNGLFSGDDWQRKRIEKVLERWFGKGGLNLHGIGDKKVNVENIFKYIKSCTSSIFYCVKRSDITENVVLDYISKFEPKEHPEEYDKSVCCMKYELETVWPTLIYRMRPTLANFEKQNDFCKLVTYEYLNSYYRKDLSIFKKLPIKFRYFYIKSLNLKDPAIGKEVYSMFSKGHSCLRHNISLFSNDVQNIIFADIEENSRPYYYNDLEAENRNLDNFLLIPENSRRYRYCELEAKYRNLDSLLLIPENQRHECFRFMDSKYRIAENLKYINSDNKHTVFACYLIPEEITYENFVKYLNKDQRKKMSLLYNIKIYKSELSYKEEMERETLFCQFKEWYKKSIEDSSKIDSEKNKCKDKEKKETNDIKFIGKKLKSDSPLDTENQSAEKIPKLEDNFQQNKNNNDGHEH